MQEKGKKPLPTFQEAQTKKPEEKTKKTVTEPDRAEVMAAELTKNKILSGRHLIKELPFFAIEPIALIAMIVMGTMLISFELLGISGKFMGINPSVIAFFLIAFLSLALYTIKRVMYFPVKNKVIVERVYKTGGSLLSAEEIPHDGKLLFFKDGKGANVFLERLYESFDVSTGRPKITCVEGYPTNVSTYDLAHDKITDRFAQKLSDVVATAEQAGEIKARNDLMEFEGKPGRDKTFILLIFILLAAIASVGLGVAALMPPTA